jgi:hypothetical protein
MYAADALEAVELLRKTLAEACTGGARDDDTYRIVRQQLLNDPGLVNELPPFIRTCRTLDDFWHFIKPEFATYRDRREFLRIAFEPLCTTLERRS